MASGAEKAKHDCGLTLESLLYLLILSHKSFETILVHIHFAFTRKKYREVR